VSCESSLRRPAARAVAVSVVIAMAASTARADDPVVREHAFQEDAGLQLGTPLSLDVTPEALYFTASSAGMGREVWRIRGRDAKAEFLRDTIPGPVGIPYGYYYLFSFPAEDARVFGEDVWYRRETELWHVDPLGALRPVAVDDVPYGATPSALGRLGDRTVLAVETTAHGSELWVHDASDESTSLLLDIATGDSDPGGGAELGDRIYFAAFDETHGRELWRTDGTAKGTELFVDLNLGAPGSNPRPFTFLDDTLMFFADDVDGVTSLWRTDGTVAGTSRVREDLALVGQLSYSAAGYEPARPDAVAFPGDGSVIFVAQRADGTRGLWYTDGTVASLATAATDPRLVGVVDGSVVFSDAFDGGRALFRATDTGTATLIAEVSARSLGSNRHLDTAIDGAIFFVADDGVHGSELWTTDGTVDGTRMVIDLEPGPGTPFQRGGLPNSAVYGGMGIAFDGVVWFDAFGTLYVTDGTAAGTHAVHIYDGDEQATEVAVAELTTRGDNLYALAYDAGSALFARDAVNGGMKRTLQPFGRTDSAGLPTPTAALDDSLLVFSHETVPARVSRLWRLDVDGLEFLKELPQTVGQGGFAHGVAWKDDLLYFGAHDTSGYALWRSDGTADGTVSLWDGRPIEIVELDGELHVSMRITPYRHEIIRTDGSASGTTLVSRRDLSPAANSSGPTGLTPFAGSLFFASGEDTNVGTELWVTDGSDAGTELFLDLLPGTASGSPGALIVLGDRLVFSSSQAFPAPRLLRTMDADGNVSALRDTDETMHSPGNPVRVGTSLFFVARDGEHGGELWKTDGTADGTVLVRDIVVGPGDSLITSLCAVDDDRVAFVAATGARGIELWTSDGTGDGTRRVTDIAPGPASSNPGLLTVHDGRLYFVASRRGEATVLYAIAISDLAQVPATADDDSPVPTVLADRFDPPPYVPPPVEPPPPEPEPEPEPEALELKALHVRLPLRAPGRDTIKLSGRLPVPDAFEPEGAEVVVDVGGAAVAFTLDRRGRSLKQVDGHRFEIDIDRRGRGDERSVRANPRAKFTFKIAKTDLSAVLADEDLVLPDGEKRVDRAIEVRITWRDSDYAATAPVRYRERRRIGHARLR